MISNAFRPDSSKNLQIFLMKIWFRKTAVHNKNKNMQSANLRTSTDKRLRELKTKIISMQNNVASRQSHDLG